MKKIIAAVLVLAMVMSLAGVAFAEESEAVIETVETEAVETVAVEEVSEVKEEVKVEEVKVEEVKVEEVEEVETEAVEEVKEVETEEVAEVEETETVEETEAVEEEVEATETTEEVVEEATETEEVAEVETEEVEAKELKTAYARVTADHSGETVEAGTEITLTAHTGNIEGNIVSITWQYTADNGKTVHTANETGARLTFTANSETVNYLWRAVITYEA